MCRHHGLGLVVLGMWALVACSGAGGGLDFPTGPVGGKKLVEELMKSSDKAGMVAKMKPTKADLEALFDPSAVETMSAYVDKVYGSIGDIGMKPEQTEVLFNMAATEDFLNATDAAKKFPGGYARLAPKLKPGVIWYAWKYVKPGETLGMAFDGLAHVNSRWVWIPKPFRAISE